MSDGMLLTKAIRDRDLDECVALVDKLCNGEWSESVWKKQVR